MHERDIGPQPHHMNTMVSPPQATQKPASNLASAVATLASNNNALQGRIDKLEGILIALRGHRPEEGGVAEVTQDAGGGSQCLPEFGWQNNRTTQMLAVIESQLKELQELVG